MVCMCLLAALNISGIYPNLTMYNQEGECGTGALVPWADRLWAITYGPHLPYGSTDKLYEITPELELIVRPESVGGTPANRMIHRESNQLVIGPYFIDAERNVRVVPPEKMPGRLTGTARHLSDPAGKVYVATMEEGLYEVDVKTLAVKTLIRDGNTAELEKHVKEGGSAPAGWDASLDSKLPGYHGKGLSSGFGRVFYANNGEFCRPWNDLREPTGALGVWSTGDRDWTLVRRRQYTDIATSDGVYGNEHPETNPVLAMGWDYRSALVDVFTSSGEPTAYRFPKASYTYDATHGWYTEWPRIRPISETEMLGTMHGTLWTMPRSFARDGVVAGLRPLSTYLKVIGDFAFWQGKVVFGCDDTAKAEFLNVRKAKGQLKTAGQSQSNLWFVDPDRLGEIGPLVGHGGVWLDDEVAPFKASEHYLFAGYAEKALYLRHGERHDVVFDLETDADGRGSWTRVATFSVPPAGLVADVSPFAGEWARLVPHDRARRVTGWFEYAGPDTRRVVAAASAYPKRASARLLVAAANPKAITVVAGMSQGWELDGELNLSPLASAAAEAVWSDTHFPSDVVQEDEASLVYVDDKGRTWRIPRSAVGVPAVYGRVCREVCTERDLFAAGGTFFELPAGHSGGFAKARAVSSPKLPIADYASWRGLLVLAVEGGVSPAVAGAEGPRVVKTPKEGLSLWLGATDDVWKLGKATGVGGPWKGSMVKAGEPSDPYLANGYDRKTITLSSAIATTITLEADPNGEGEWYPVADYRLSAGETRTEVLPPWVNASWLRVRSSANTIATAQFTYE
ncbi:MAG: hypothetical protein II840_05795 [Kiritimatiellae bacterium]|nr:hypothetical protein [Kiritimatiellia bacterium]